MRILSHDFPHLYLTFFLGFRSSILNDIVNYFTLVTTMQRLCCILISLNTIKAFHCLMLRKCFNIHVVLWISTFPSWKFCSIFQSRKFQRTLHRIKQSLTFVHLALLSHVTYTGIHFILETEPTIFCAASDTSIIYIYCI